MLFACSQVILPRDLPRIPNHLGLSQIDFIVCFPAQPSVFYICSAPWPTKLGPSYTPKAALGSHVPAGARHGCPQDVKQLISYYGILLLPEEDDTPKR